ncbi:MAG: hypothetical protein CL678_15220, partial [Bdellovibrionaceae bacterium]|nr:hypothetical protein [Pseudobdellovibrionaceae bacterium]
ELRMNTPAYPNSGASVPTAAGNLITHLAVKSGVEGVVNGIFQNSVRQYPGNFDLDSYDFAIKGYRLRQLSDGPDRDSYVSYDDSNPIDRPHSQYLFGGTASYGNEPNISALMGTTSAGTDLLRDCENTISPFVTPYYDNCPEGLQTYLDVTNRLLTKKKVKHFVPQQESDYAFVDRHQPPFLLHIKLECLKETDYSYTEGIVRVVTPERNPVPLQNFYGSTQGHTIAVYNKNKNAGFFGGSGVELEGASGLSTSRPATNVRGCDKTSTRFFQNAASCCCIRGITTILDEAEEMWNCDPAANEYEAYFTSPIGEKTDTEADLRLGGSVPVAAGNLIAYLASKREGVAAYPKNYGHDSYTPSNHPLGPGFYTAFLAFETSKIADPKKENETPDHYFFGGTVSQNQSRNLFNLMKHTAGVGTYLDDARKGLQDFLDNTNRLGPTKVVLTNRTDDLDDVAFVQQFEPPYLLHMDPACLAYPNLNFKFGFTFAGNPKIGIDLRKGFFADDEVTFNFYGSTLGHTITVYRQELSNVVNPDGEEWLDPTLLFGSQPSTKLILYGASGVSSMRPKSNVRGCDEARCKLSDTQKCVYGVTQIHIVSAPKKMSGGMIAAITVSVLIGVVLLLAGMLSRKGKTQNGDQNVMLM